MKRLAALFVLLASGTASASFCGGYTYQRTLTVNASQVSTGTLNYQSFPVLISTNEVTLSTTTGSGGHLSTGYDLIISSDSNCQFPVNFDTETVQNVGVSTMNVWAKLDFSSSTNRTYYITYGNSSITSYQGISTATWDSSLAAVFHLGGPATVNPHDSTINGNNSSNSGVFISTTGKIDGGGSSRPSSVVLGGLSIAATSGINNLANFTYSFWFNPANCINFRADSEQELMSMGGGVSFEMLNDCTLLPIVLTNASFREVQTNDVLPTNAWSYIVGIFSNSTNLWHVFINGVEATYSSTSTGSGTTTNMADPSVIGAQAFNQFGGIIYGNLDEVRVANVVRSADWIKTEYRNQSSPQTFLTIGPEIAASIPPSAPNFSIKGGNVLIQGVQVSIK